MLDYELQFIDAQDQRDPFWDDDLYDQRELEFKHIFSKPPERTEYDNINTDSHVSDKLRYASIDLRTVFPQRFNTSRLPKFRRRFDFIKCQNSVIDT